MPPIRRWAPVGPAKAQVVIVHGIAEHSGRYEHVGALLAEAGYRATALDLRGHGEADGWPGKVGAPDEWLDDLDAVVSRTREEGDAPLFLIAHSMGTLVTLAYLAERGQRGIRGVVLSGTAVAPGQAILDSLADPDGPGVPPEKLSHDDAMNRNYAEDPLIFYKDVPPECTAAAMLCAQRAFAGASRISLPALLLHGGADQICDPSGSSEVHAAMPSADKTLRIYEGLYHEIFNEVERERVLGDVIAWLDARV